MIEYILLAICFPMYLVIDYLVRRLRSGKKYCNKRTDDFLKLFLIFYLFTYGAVIFILGG